MAMAERVIFRQRQVTNQPTPKNDHIRQLFIASLRSNGQDLSGTASRFSAVDWDALPTQAELHGLGPHLYLALKQASIDYPKSSRLALRGLYLRHRRANQLRTDALAEILQTYRMAGIKVLVLKGAALAHLIYPEPGLRPMSDLDILVSPEQVIEAQRLLTTLGYCAPLPMGSELPNKHLTVASKQHQGLSVRVEVHHSLFDQSISTSLTWADFVESPLSFALPGNRKAAYTLNPTDMIGHLCQHLVWNIRVFNPIRLRWMVDIQRFVTQFGDEIDWVLLQHRWPEACTTLALIHLMLPLDKKTRQQGNLSISGRFVADVGRSFQGWPRFSLADQAEKDPLTLLRDTFSPGEWWLRLRYNRHPNQSIIWQRWIKHPLVMAGWLGEYYIERYRT